MPCALSAAIVPLTDFSVAVEAAMAATRTREALPARCDLLLLARGPLAGRCGRGCCGRADTATMRLETGATTLQAAEAARDMVRGSGGGPAQRTTVPILGTRQLQRDEMGTLTHLPAWAVQPAWVGAKPPAQCCCHIPPPARAYRNIHGGGTPAGHPLRWHMQLLV